MGGRGEAPLAWAIILSPIRHNTNNITSDQEMDQRYGINYDVVEVVWRGVDGERRRR